MIIQMIILNEILNGLKEMAYLRHFNGYIYGFESRMLHFWKNPVIMQKSRSCGVFQYNGWHRNPKFGTIFQ